MRLALWVVLAGCSASPTPARPSPARESGVIALTHGGPPGEPEPEVARLPLPVPNPADPNLADPNLADPKLADPGCADDGDLEGFPQLDCAPREVVAPSLRLWAVPKLRSLDTFRRAVLRCSSRGMRPPPPGSVVLAVTWTGGAIVDVVVTADPGLADFGQCLAMAARAHLPAHEDGVVTIPFRLVR